MERSNQPIIHISVNGKTRMENGEIIIEPNAQIRIESVEKQ